MAKLMVDGGATVSGTEYTLRDIARSAEKNILNAIQKESVTTGNNTNDKIKLISNNSIGNKLTINNDGIKVGAGISYVKVSASATFSTVSGTNSRHHLLIFKNSSGYSDSILRLNGNWQTMTTGEVLIPVQQNDTIYLYTRTQDSSGSVLYAAYVCVFEVPSVEGNDLVTVPNDSTIVALTSALNRIETLGNFYYPVGSIYLSVNSTDPSLLFGGTWEAFATGRTLVGIDTAQTEFNSIEKTGGSKFLQSHSHDAINYATGYYDGSQTAYYTILGGSQSGSVRTAVRSAGTGNSGNLQPYVVVYMWKRIA